MKRISIHLLDPFFSRLHGQDRTRSKTAKKGSFFSKPLRIKRKIVTFAFFIVFLLISQVVASTAMVRAEDDIPSADFGIQQSMNALIEEQEEHAASLDESLDSTLSSHYHNATNQVISESEVYSDHQLPEMVEELIDPVPENVKIETLDPIEPKYPRIFDLAEHSSVNETDTVMETLLDGQENYMVHTDYFPSDGGPRLSTWTQGSLLPSILDESQGFKLNDWNGINVDENPNTGDVDKDTIEDLIGSFPEGSDIYVRVTVEVPLLGDLSLLSLVNFIIFDLPDYLNGSDLELEAGLKIQIRKDSYWEDEDLEVDVGILKGIGYETIEAEGIEYIWIGDFNFSDVPQEFEFLAMLETVSIHMDDLSLDALLSIFTNLLDATGDEAAPYDFASFAPPYTVNFIIDQDGQNPLADDDDSIAEMDFLLGYDKLQSEDGSHIVVDRTYISARITPNGDQTVIPKQFHVKLHGKKDLISGATSYDTIEWYSRRPVNVSAIYSEGKLNDTYIVVDIEHMPFGNLPGPIIDDEIDYSSLRINLQNLSTVSENYTSIHYEATEEIKKVELWGFEYANGYEVGHQYNSTHLKVEQIPSDIRVHGNFVLSDPEDPFTVFNNASLTFINGIVDDAMLALASSLYAIGLKLRSIPDSLSTASGTQGVIEVQMRDDQGDEDYLGMAELAIAYGYVSPNPAYYGRYATTTIENHDYLMTYIDKNIGVSGVPDKVAISLRFSGLGDVRYEAWEDEVGDISEVEIILNTDPITFYNGEGGQQFQYAYDENTGNMPKMEIFYLTGRGDDFQGEDYARIAVSNLPETIKISLKENVTIYDATDPDSGRDEIDGRIIRYISYESLIEGQYMEFNVTHIPEYIKFLNNDTILSVSSLQIPQDAPPGEEWKPKYYTNENDYLNLEFLITNESQDGKIVKRSMPSNYVVIYKNEDITTINGSVGVAGVSGRFNGLKSLYYASDEINEIIEVEIRLENPDQENLAIRMIDDSAYITEKHAGLRGSAIIGPLPEYLHVTSQRPEPEKSVVEPDTANLDDISDIEPFMNSVKEFGRSIVDVMLDTIDDTLKGVGMTEESNFWMDFSMKDPVLGTAFNMDIIADISRGDVDHMYDQNPEYSSRAYWTSGVSMRQHIIDKEREEAVFEVKVYLTGLPSTGSLSWNQSGDKLDLQISISDFDPKLDWVVIDVKGIGDIDMLVHATGLVGPMEMEFGYNSEINATDNMIDLNLHASITSLEEPVVLGEVFAAIWSNASDFTRLQTFIPQVPSTVDLSLNIDRSLELDYAASQGLDYLLMDLKIGDTELLPEEAYRTHGVVVRNGTDGNGDQIMHMTMYMEGIPDLATIDFHQEGDKMNLALEVESWDPDTDWVIIDIMGLNETDVFLYQVVPQGNPIDIKLDIDLIAPQDRNEVLASAIYRASRDMGGMFLKLRSNGLIYPVIIQVYLPEVPRHLTLELRIMQGIFADFSASKGLDHVFVRLHRYVNDAWHTLTLMMHEVPTYVQAKLEQNTNFDPERSVLLQGNPNINLKCSQDGMDIYLDLDSEVSGNYGHILLQVGDLTNNTRLYLSEPDVYSIYSPGGVGYVYFVLSELPILEIIKLNELYIYAEDTKSVDIHVRQLFGLYPVFKLSNADGGRIHVKLAIEAGSEGNRVPLEAGVLDVKYRTLPLFAPLFVNHISTSLSTNHYIVPEPITTVFATVLAVLRGLGGVMI